MSKVAIILTEGFADWEYAFIGGTGGPFYGLEVRYFAPEAGDLHSQGGLVARVPDNLEQMAVWQPDVLVVVGGMIWETGSAPDISHSLQASYASGATLAGICGGTLALARAGLLDHVPHTSNDENFLGQNAEQYAGKDQYRDSRSAVASDRIVTAPGSAPVSFTAEVLASAGVDSDAVSQFKDMLAAELS